jgi:ribosomal subunit interface protein
VSASIIKIQGRKVEITPSIEEFIQEKVTKALSNYAEILREVNVTVSVAGNHGKKSDSAHHKRSQKAEVTVYTHRHGVVRVEDTEDDLYAAVDLVCDKMKRKMVRLKEKAVQKNTWPGRGGTKGGARIEEQVMQSALDSLDDGEVVSGLKNRQGLSPEDLARKRLGAGGKAVISAKTLIVAPPECLRHYTAPYPHERDDDPPPPENVNRLRVLTDSEVGSLRTSAFSGDYELAWDQKSRRATMADVLKVHDWAYVLKLKNATECIEHPERDIRHLDGDTTISGGTFDAALAAAGAVCHAVDEVMSGRAKNSFCPVRPPGHHAGPHGVVPSRRDPNGSHGFCLLNNVAIGAAYAMSVYRHAGVKKVAILDFDVHHGNGTEACVANTAPSLDTFEFATPYGKGTQTFPVYKPWCDETDRDNVFFASVQGYGPKGYGIGAFVYPGSGATCDTKQLARHVEAEIDEVNGGGDGGDLGGEGKGTMSDSGALGASEQDPLTNIEEDPDGEFVYVGGEVPRTEGPRIIDVGIPGPGHHVPMWKRSWRDKIFPALVKFDPDLIILSAGFDAHRKDDINFSYIGIQEKDFEWITDQVVQVANKCCKGRIVSVLEGGYRIQGNVVSAFARSVAAHVRALAEPNLQVWDPADSKFEREREKRLRAEAEAKAKRRAEEARVQAEAAQAEKDAERDAAEGVGDARNEDPAPMDTKPIEEASSPLADGGRGKRRRGAVDYKALEAQLRKEEAQKKS